MRNLIFRIKMLFMNTDQRIAHVFKATCEELKRRMEYEMHLGRPLTNGDIPIPKKPWRPCE